MMRTGGKRGSCPRGICRARGGCPVRSAAWSSSAGQRTALPSLTGVLRLRERQKGDGVKTVHGGQAPRRIKAVQTVRSRTSPQGSWFSLTCALSAIVCRTRNLGSPSSEALSSRLCSVKGDNGRCDFLTVGVRSASGCRAARGPLPCQREVPTSLTPPAPCPQGGRELPTKPGTESAGAPQLQRIPLG